MSHGMDSPLWTPLGRGVTALPRPLVESEGRGGGRVTREGFDGGKREGEWESRIGVLTT